MPLTARWKDIRAGLGKVCCIIPAVMEKQSLPKMVAQPAQLTALVAKLAEQPVVAVDTESNGLFAYREQVCLIQFSIPEDDYLVDPLALKDLSPLAEIFSDPRIEKVFHAAEYDLLCLKRDFGFEFSNLFDTMLAARILGQERVGLGNILADEFGVHLKKRYQRANWGRRPLPPEMQDYARLDTHYLIRLRDRLRAELLETGRWPIAQEDFARLCEVDGELLTPPETDIWGINGARDLTPQQVAILQELADYRQKTAEAQDRPLFKVIGDKTLTAIAAAEPDTLDDLGEVPGMSAGQVRRHGRRLLEAVKRGQQAEPLRPPRRPRSDPRYIERLEELRTWRKHTAQKIGVSSDVVLPRDLLVQIARQNPASQDELSQIMACTPWRLQQYGARIHKLLASL